MSKTRLADDAEYSEGFWSRNWLKVAVLTVVILITSMVIFTASLRNIPAGFKGVIVSGPNGPSYEEIPEGWHFVPFWVGVEIHHYRTEQIAAIGLDEHDDNVGSIQATSRDNLNVLVDANLLYRIPEDKVADIRIKLGDYISTLLIPLMRSVPRDVISNFDAFELRGVQRATIETLISTTLEKELATYDITLVRYALQGIRLDESVEEAIEAKKIAEQNLIKAQIEYQTALIQAAAEANSTVIRAQGNAEAIRIITDMFKSMDNSTLNAYLLWYFIQALQNPDSNVQYIIIWDGQGIPIIIQPTP